VGFLGILGGRADVAIPELEHGLSELRHAGLSRLMMTSLHNLADLHMRQGNLDLAEEYFAEALQASIMAGAESNVHLNRGFLGYVKARRGALEEGAAYLQRAADGLAQDTGSHHLLVQLRILQAEVEHMRGQTARARRRLEEIVAELTASHELSLANLAQEMLSRIEQETRTAFIHVEDPPVAEGRAEDDTVRTRPVE
jgi:ATP/maltotriose-dependent transcriptional regulator MalT